MRSGRWLLLALALTVAAANASAQTVRVAGSTTVRPFVQAAAKAWMARHPEVMVLVGGGGSGAGARKLLDGQADVAMMSRPATDAEARGFRKLHAEPHAVGLDGVVIVVSDDIYHAGVHAISRAEARAIWAGRIANWKKLGGPDRRILTAGRIVGSGTESVFSAWLWGGPGRHARPMVPLESNRYARNLLTASDQAIGYLPLGWTNEDVHPLALKTDAGVIRPDAQSIRDGRWPMARKLVLWVRKDAPDHVREFVEWLASPEARTYLEQAGYFPLKP